MIRRLLKQLEDLIRDLADQEHAQFPDRYEIAYLKRQIKKARNSLLQSIDSK